MGRKKQRAVQEEATTTVRTWRPRARQATLDTMAPPRARPASVALEPEATTAAPQAATAAPEAATDRLAAPEGATAAPEATTELLAAPEGTAAPEATTAELMAAAPEVEPAAEAII